MSEQEDVANDLVSKAQRQLDEHKAWLVREIDAPGTPLLAEDRLKMISHVNALKLRVVKTSGRVVAVVYEYPDDLYKFLKSDAAPRHLRDSVSGGHVVDPNQPITDVKRVDGEGDLEPT